MQPTDLLVQYGYLVIGVTMGFVLIPYLRGKTDLLTGWNILLVGCAIYTGLGCLAVHYREFFWRQLFFQPTRELVNWYLGCSLVFLIALFTSYYLNPISVSLASRSLQKWPTFSLPVVIYTLIISLIIIAAAFLLADRPGFFASVARNLAHKAVVFSTVFAFALWYRNKLNAGYLALFIGVLIAAGLYAMLIFLGRRLLLSVALGPIVYVYWSTLRNWSPKTNLIVIGTAASAIFLVGNAYASFRHFSKGVRGEERTIRAIVERVRNIDLPKLVQTSFEHTMSLPQQNVQYSMLVRRSVDEGLAVPKPLNTLVMLTTYPIPRVIWPGKPRTIGDLMPTQVLHVRSKRGLNWGVGPPGHAAYEGGLPVLVLYAVLLTFGIRFLDEPLRRQPTNPFLISILASAAPHVLGLPRGDFFIMSIETIECFIFAIVVGIGGRMLFGTEQTEVRNRMYTSPSTYNRPLPGQLPGPRNMTR